MSWHWRHRWSPWEQSSDYLDGHNRILAVQVRYCTDLRCAKVDVDYPCPPIFRSPLPASGRGRPPIHPRGRIRLDDDHDLRSSD
jgi:hypothetical protein